jgi:hypothetical protein
VVDGCKETRREVIDYILQELDGRLDAIGIRIIADETNNTPEVIDSQQLVAKVEWRESKFTNDINYIDLVFGRDVEVDWGDEPSMIGETFRNQLIEEGIEPNDVVSFVSNYNKKTNAIVTVVTMEDGTEKTIVAETAWYASRKNKKW